MSNVVLPLLELRGIRAAEAMLQKGLGNALDRASMRAIRRDASRIICPARSDFLSHGINKKHPVTPCRTQQSQKTYWRK